jgi:hypothetical protein
MPAATAQDRRAMPRPPTEKPKGAILNFRTYPEVRDAVEAIAREEHRTVAAMADLLLREAIVARRKAAKKPTADIENLP